MAVDAGAEVTARGSRDLRLSKLYLRRPLKQKTVKMHSWVLKNPLPQKSTNTIDVYTFKPMETHVCTFII